MRTVIGVQHMMRRVDDQDALITGIAELQAEVTAYVFVDYDDVYVI